MKAAGMPQACSLERVVASVAEVEQAIEDREELLRNTRPEPPAKPQTLGERPTDGQIIRAVATMFATDTDTAAKWIREMSLSVPA